MRMLPHILHHGWAHLCRIIATRPRLVFRLHRPRVLAGSGVALIALVAGAYALRGPEETQGAQIAPRAADRLAVVMQVPAEGGKAPAWARAPFETAPDIPATAVPRLAALSLPEDAGARVSRLSRIFRGPPPVVPPARPGAGRPEGAAAPAEAEPRRVTASVRPRSRPVSQPVVQPTAQAQPFAVLRPRARPGDLAIRSAVTVALRAAPVAAAPATAVAAPAPATRPRAQASLPAAPRIVPASAQCPARLSRDMPRRARSAEGASVVMARLDAVDGVTRDRHAAREILSGNIPGFLRNLRPVSIRGLAADGSTVVVTLCVTPDYLALGSNADYARIPLGLRAATRIGDAFNMMLPTPRMVDLIHRGASTRLLPKPMPAGPQMTSTGYLMQHNATIDAQRARAGAAPGTLISGHKKDVVLTTRLASMPGRVAIYGWHRGNGQPIQPLSTVHGAGYADYSHGVRLVSRTAFLNGRPVDLRDLIASPLYASLLSDEGPVAGPRLRMAALAAN